MEEQFLFTQVHDALDIPTPPGAYERLRSELTKKPVRARRWPVFQMRTSDMRFRLAAGLAIVAIAVAAAAAVLAVHNASNNVSPAGSRMSIAAYQKMVEDDNSAAAATFSAPCGTGTYTGCGSDATRAIPVVQAWINDVSRRDIPDRFAVINAEIKQHLLQTIPALHDLVAASKNKDVPGMDRALWTATYAADWTSTVLPSIAASHQVDESAYMRLVASEVRTVDTCGAICGWAGNGDSCTATNDPLTCQYLFDGGIGPIFAGFAGDLVKEAAPASFASKDARLQNDLAQADAILMTMRVAVGANDQTGFSLGLTQLLRIKTQIDRDAKKITG